jgi:hypothetical protein
VALTSVPLTPRERWWTKLAKLPVLFWSISRDTANVLTERSHQQPSKRKLALIRLVALAGILLLSPLLVVVALRGRRATAFDALYDRVIAIWQTSDSEAIALLRATYQQLVTNGAFTDMKAVQIAPFGRFGTHEVVSVHRFLYDCEFRLGNFEEAMTVEAALPGRADTSILRQVDCLVALDRKADAIALLERNLDVDGWRGKLRRRLMELGGRHLRTVE